ncbi:von Willebrand factor type A domain-containing protein [Chaetomidium leptoderma]|uniref:von Willebrand factor type A domain-containing protein n=1 Tax=Chaetomidium leptoderma TaxID=669021 RepID=A0AAN6VIU1_9PEZI|nr:von Willebrand factor type A domain-containing protein [Chaetomidium leptoderma]
MARYNHICGLYYVVGKRPRPERQYLPQLSLSVHTKIISSTSRTTLTQNFVNPKSDAIPELRYTFPLYDGVSVVGFVCTINGDRVIRGVVKERAEAKQTYQAAVDRGETAGLLEQLPDASDVFTTTIGNIPANATLKVEITYLGELKHDAEVDGIRFTIPTHIAPRYGSYPGQLLRSSTVSTEGGISIVVDVEMPSGSNVKNVQSPSHPISVTLGNTSAGAASGADMSLQKASATLALSTAELGDDFVLQVVATNTANPVAVLETHPTLPNHRALMATLVPKFNLPSSRPEIVFLCDRSGSMGDGRKIPNLKTALHLFLKSMPVGVKFNICSFGSHHEFLFPTGSRTYDASALEEATRYVDRFSANFGGTDIYQPMEDVFKKRYTDMDLEVFLLTDGEIWDQAALFRLLNKDVAESKGRIRVFSLGIGSDVSHALIEGVANAGNGFSQSVGDNENMNSKVVRMLKASLTPHIKDYTLEVKYHKEPAANSDDEFEIVEKVMDALAIDARQIERKEEAPKKPISLFDESANPDVEMTDASRDTSAGGKYSHLPSVPEPHFLQAPFNIPPLFSFSRTTVYLLLSPETVQKQPKSVILRGTSPYGPVELEIPVTVLATKDETIHQLAARKAVKELEEGRGWIYHAKNAKGDAGSLLKDLYPGRFDDMVEREAVRLGVTYQVGGKWCSFVAVEGNQETEDKARNMPQAMSCSAAPNASSRGLFGIGPTRSVARSAGAPPPPLPSFAPRMATTSLSAVAPPPPPPGGASSHRKRSVIGGGAPSGGAPSGGLFTRGSMTKKPARKPRRNVPLGVCAVEESITDDELAPPVDTNLDLLVGMQSFSGAWQWDEGLLVLLGLWRRGFVAPEEFGGASDRFATALVLAFLEVVLAEKEDEWEMLADKALAWLVVELGDEAAVEVYREKAKEFLKKEAGLV